MPPLPVPLPQLRWRRGGNVSAIVRTDEAGAAGDQEVHGQTLTI